jgi:hypothetical protein
VGFFTLSFADHVTCAKEAGRRFNSLNTHVISKRYVETIAVLERMKSGRIHFHLLVVLPGDIRTGFNFDQAANGVYGSANELLREEWKFWRGQVNYDGHHPFHPYATFGRTELLPVKSNQEGISKYVGKYISKHVGAREARDRGVRLVRYSRSASVGSNAFMFQSPRSRLWRWQVSKFAEENGCSESELRSKFGPRWVYRYGSYIRNLEPPGHITVCALAPGQKPKVSIDEHAPKLVAVSIWEVWHMDRLCAAAAVAESTGATHAEAYVHLFQPMFRDRESVEIEVPRWNPQDSQGKPCDVMRNQVESCDITWNHLTPDDVTVKRVRRDAKE